MSNIVDTFRRMKAKQDEAEYLRKLEILKTQNSLIKNLIDGKTCEGDLSRFPKHLKPQLDELVSKID